MAIWMRTPSVDLLQDNSKGTMVEYLGIIVEEVGEDFLICSMPVDHRTHQPMGILHGGASVVLAETVGSIAANLAVDHNHYCVGLEINANHLRSVRSGRVMAKATPVHLGRSTQVWDIRIVDENEKKVCISRLTMAVLNR